MIVFTPRGPYPKKYPSGRFAYVINELHPTIAILSFDLERGRFQLVDVIRTLPAGYHEGSHCADLQITRDGRFLYGSNRGHDSIVIYGVDHRTGDLMLIGHQSSLGETPRNIAIDPSGQYLIVANQNSDTLIVFRRDNRTGKLSDIRKPMRIGTPMCVKFAVFQGAFAAR